MLIVNFENIKEIHEHHHPQTGGVSLTIDLFRGKSQEINDTTEAIEFLNRYDKWLSEKPR